MTRPRHEIEILTELGYDPDDPSYTVQMIENAGVPITDADHAANATYEAFASMSGVTATETTSREEDSELNELEDALKQAITALQRVLELIT